MKAIFNIFSLSIFIFLWVGCSNNDPSVNATRLRINLTDAPLTRADSLTISELNVDIQRIEVSLVDTVNNNENWITLDFNGGVYDILPLTNGKTKQIIDQYFPTGILRKMRIVFGENTSLNTSTGIKKLILDERIKDGVVVDVNANLYAYYISSILVDINALTSIYESNGNYFFRPQLRVFAETFGGSLKGYVLPLNADPRVFVINDRDTFFTLPEKTDGMFMFKGLKEGVWDIYIIAGNREQYQDSIFSDSIVAGKTTEIKSKIQLKEITITEDDEDEGNNGDENNGEN